MAVTGRNFGLLALCFLQLWSDPVLASKHHAARSVKQGSRLRRNRDRDLQDTGNDPRSEKCDKSKHSCAPSAAPSVSMVPSAAPSSMPSSAPTTSHMPSVSLEPSAAPSVSPMPSSAPSPQPSGAPSGMPSRMPTGAPTPVPTGAPTLPAPTVSPAPTKSPQPTAMPSPDPFGVTTRIITNPNGETGVVSNCRLPIPATATSIEDQAIIFDYTLNLVAGADFDLAIDFIATRLHREITPKFLDCMFDPGSDFYVHALTSLPMDLPREEGCGGEDAEGVDCYVVNAAFVSQIFYQPSQRRKLQASETITDANVYNAFTVAIDEIFASGALTEGFQDIISAEFNEITNEDPNEDESISSISAPRGSDKSLSAGAVAGITVGAIVGVAIVAALVAFALTRSRKRNGSKDAPSSEVFQEVDSLSSSEAADDDMSKGMIGDKSILSDDTSFLTSEQPTKAYVLNDEQSLDTGFYPELTPQESQEEKQPPTFQTVGTVMSVSPYRVQGVDDTVDL